ncbi:MAG: hypothetical protein JXB48_00660 [Candidatus Latescibacteria bacterium]|nr:hypothetical protein [Candidatus Latescibacterota bacterium]
MGELWEKIRKSVVDGVQIAAEKTEEYTKIGKAKIEILNLKRKISKSFTELGGIMYESIKEKSEKDVLKSDQVKDLISTLNNLDAELEAKEKYYEEMVKKEEPEEA